MGFYNRKIKLLATAVVLSGMFSCRENKEVGVLDNLDGFEVVKSEHILDSCRFLSPFTLTMAGNTLLVSENQAEGMLGAFDLNNETALGGIGMRGRGPNEFMNMRVVRYSDQDSLLFILDTGSRKASYFKFNPENPMLSENNLVKLLDLKSANAHDIQPSKYGLITDVVNGDDLFALLDDNGGVKYTFGKYPGDNKGIENPIEFLMAHQALFCTNPGGNKFVLAGAFSDWVAFYNIKADSAELSKEYFTFETPVNVHSSGDEGEQIVSMRYLPETKLVFTQLIPTDNYVYIVYSGATNAEIEAGEKKPKSILKFNWDGEFINGYRLDVNTITESVTSDDKYIIASTEDEDGNFRILRFTM